MSMHDRADLLSLPYASAAVDAEGYHVTCPECGEVCRPQPADLVKPGTAEDVTTKGAALAYARHYESAARREAEAIR